ncbi:MAG TPA: thioesterase family protein [Acidimicrobiia bacterium]
MANTITIQRRVQWVDTDAAGIWHHSVATRWFEEAEAELHRSLGISEQTFGATPRVRTEFTFDMPIRFDDLVEITFTVAALGETSVTYELEIEHGQTHVASGLMVAVLIDRATGEKRPWPDELREALSP